VRHLAASLTKLVNLVELQKAAQLAEVQRIKLQFEYQTLAEQAASDFVMMSARAWQNVKQQTSV
jgi:hypothetical protein